MNNFYLYIRWLSIDIVLGAIFFLYYLGEYFNVIISPHDLFALAGTIWIIYTIDHLIDAQAIRRPTSGRHRFHKRNARLLTVISGTVLTLLVLNLYFLREEVIRNGALLAAFCTGYLTGVFFFRKIWFKEVLVALGYACGIFLVPFSLVPSFSMQAVYLTVQLVLVAFTNLLIFSYYDRDTDAIDGFSSLALRIGARTTHALICVCLLLLILSCLLIGLHLEVQIMYFAMSLILGSVFLFPSLYRRASLYRTVGDGVFYLPGLLLAV